LFATATGDDQGLDPSLPGRPVKNRQRHPLGDVLSGNFEATQMRRDEYYSFAEFSRCFHVSPTLAFNHQLVGFMIASEPYFCQLDRSFTGLANGFLKQRAILTFAGANRAGAQILSQSPPMSGPTPVHDPADHHADAMQPTKRQSSD
jgi:hypothetical protein